MKYCYNCGYKLCDWDLFCSSCGCKQESNTLSCKKQSYEDDYSSDSKYGIIFTDTLLLSMKLKVTQSDVQNLLVEYCKTLKISGVQYAIVDVNASNNSLQPNNDSWIKYSQLLLDNYKRSIRHNTKPLYLFIIGGSDVIPMPKISNPLSNSDDDVDSDLLYSYLFDYTFKCNNFDFLQNKYYLHTGRLPLGTDAEFECLTHYLEKIKQIISNEGFHINSAYGQIDMNWGLESSIVSEYLLRQNLLPAKYDSLSELYSYKRLIKTPEVTKDTVRDLINKNANLYYFNMHGSNTPGSSPETTGWVGAYPPAENGETTYVCGVSPKEMSKVQELNICVTEACYGARFIGYDHNSSMLLSTMNNKTIAFLGSSRISLGSGLTDASDNSELTNADIICKVFMEELISGSSLGVALNNARQQLVANATNIAPGHYLSLLEFNLFGDPSICAAIINNNAQSEGAKYNYASLLPFISSEDNIYVNTVNIYNNQEQSILNMARQQVNTTHVAILNIINKKLYDFYNLEHRDLQIADIVTYRNGEQEYILYLNDMVTNIMYIAVANVDGNIKRVITSK